MAITPAHAEVRDQHIADLRDALMRVRPQLGFAAGQLAADNPEYAEQLMAAADELTEILNRTAPE